ncbi:YqxA family protein [Peribacillus sp. SCS-37]|uniref:YqxA family protein n=1 Tax=Paraperibacillus esterisolvens TaxID=3115296 RepID=UPI0039062269
MVRFSFKVLMLILVLFFGVLLGMQHANTSMKKMKGFDDPSLDSAFSIHENNGGKQASILGETVTGEDLAEKKQKLEEMKAYNFFSQTGRKISEGVSNGFDKLFGTSD